MADKKEATLGSGMAEKARRLLKGRRSAIEDRLKEILGDGPTPDRTKRVQKEPEDNQDTRRSK